MTDKVDLLMICDPLLPPQLEVRGVVNSDPSSYFGWIGIEAFLASLYPPAHALSVSTLAFLSFTLNVKDASPGRMW